MFPQIAPAAIFAIQGAYCLVNLWILSGWFPLDTSSTADSSWLFCREQAEAECSVGLVMHFAWSLCPGPHQHRVCLSLCPCHSPPCSSSVIPALLQTHCTDILKNSGIHPQYGFLLIIAFCLWRLHVLLTLQSPWLFAQLFLPLCISENPAIIFPPFFITSFHYPFFLLYFFPVFPYILLIPSGHDPFFMPPEIRVSAKLRSLMSLRLGSDTLDVHWLNAPGLNSPLSLNSKRQLYFTCHIIAHRLKFYCFCFEFTSFTGSTLLFRAGIFFSFFHF